MGDSPTKVDALAVWTPCGGVEAVAQTSAIWRWPLAKSLSDLSAVDARTITPTLRLTQRNASLAEPCRALTAKNRPRLLGLGPLVGHQGDLGRVKSLQRLPNPRVGRPEETREHPKLLAGADVLRGPLVGFGKTCAQCYLCT